MKIGERLKKAGARKTVQRSGPLWKGPEEDGITFSLLSRFLNCRERFRLLVIEGLKPADGFNHRIQYGNMWHLCEEEYSRCQRDPTSAKTWKQAVNVRLADYATKLCNIYRTQQEQVDHWYNVCKTQFPYYVEYWNAKTRKKADTPLLVEEKFRVPYLLPSGRTVQLRGKWDSVLLIHGRKTGSVYLWENKTKGEIIEEQIKKQLTFDLQTMLYVIALHEGRYLEPLINVIPKGCILSGVIYNVVRRPLSGGKGTIVRKKPSKSNPDGESKADFYKRLGKYFEGEPESYFMRWQVEVSQQDIERFKRECFNPILEQLCDWWGYMQTVVGPRQNPFDYDPHHGYGAIHWRHPYGVRNFLDEGYSSELDEYLHSGSDLGLDRTNNLFPELS